MSGIYIPGLGMPPCGATMILIFPNGDVRGMKYGSDKWELLGQAIDLPPHGDLIDREALRAEVKKRATPSDAWVFSLIRTASAVIPADPPVMFYPQVPGITPTVISDKEGEE